jgi:hypothetical protein
MIFIVVHHVIGTSDEISGPGPPIMART